MTNTMKPNGGWQAWATRWAQPGPWHRRLKILGVIYFLLPDLSHAEGLRNPPAGAFSLGRAGGRIAQIDDSSAVAQNPANLVDLSESDFQVAPSLVRISAEYHSPDGQSARTEDPWKLLPNVFFSTPLANQKMAVGIGVTTPYGLGNTWDEDSSAFARPLGSWRYYATRSAELKTINFNPSFAAKIHERLSFGAGLDVFWSELTLKQFYPWFLATGNLADPDGLAKAKADGVGVGGNVGLTWSITDRQRLAVTYRYPVEVDYEGHFHLDNIPAALGGGSLRSPFKSNIQFPTIVAVGYGIQLTPHIRLEADVEWLQFSNFDALPLNVQTPPPGLPSQVAEDWHDTFTAGIGADWQFAPNWTLRGGYQFYQSPVPDHTFSPAIPDANQNVFTVGIAFRHKAHTVELAYGADFYDERNITNDQNPAFNGRYNVAVHLFALSYRYSF
jgi:long-chain fatty acid transport protein